MPEVPSKADLDVQAHEGRPITQAEASDIASAESLITERGPIKGGAAATAQSLHDKQQNFLGKAGEVARKPASEVTKEDAAEVQKAEVSFCVLHPTIGYLSAVVGNGLANKIMTGTRCRRTTGKGVHLGECAVHRGY